jgi:hypothetical protein
MLNQTKLDFSQESNLKQRLFKDIKKEYERARQQIELSDDDLEKVVAAGNGEQCPLPDQTCEHCDKYKLGICTAGYTKGGG